MRKNISKILSLLGGRVARNIYLWAIMLFVVFNINYNNEQAYHYGIIHSRWYYYVIITGTILQMALLYINNLVLAPRYLKRKKYKVYFLSAFLLLFAVSATYTFGLKLANQHIDVRHTQQMGFISMPLNEGWDIGGIVDDTLGFMFGNSIWLLVFTMAWYMQEYYRQQKILAASEKKRIEAELHFLKSQINPHFLFNTLNNIYGLSIQKADHTPDVILKLSSILRYVLYDSNTELVSFKKEKEIMEAYIDLELIRLQNNKDFQFQIESDRAYHVPPLLWMPVLENLFKHGTRYIAEQYRLDFKCTIQEGRMYIYGQNSYKQVNGQEVKKAGGIGLENLKKRLALLYEGRHELKVVKEADIFTIHVEIELYE